MPSSREQLRLQEIVDNIDRIARHIDKMDYITFVGDPKTVDAVERCLQRITEAVIKIGSERMADISPQLQVHQVRAFGNLLRHSYDEVSPKRVFETVEIMLPNLRSDCMSALNFQPPDLQN